LRLEEPPSHVRARRKQRSERLRTLGYQSYRAYMASPHWHRVRAAYRASELPQECICGDDDVHLHHMTYERVGAERLTDLTPLCGRCHALVHILEWRGEVALNLEGLFDSGRAAEGRALLQQLADAGRRAREQHVRDEQREVLGMTFAARLLRAHDRAKYDRHMNISNRVFIIRRMVAKGASNEALTRRLRDLEEVVYGWDGWADPHQ
jgi:hypothetical protein